MSNQELLENAGLATTQNVLKTETPSVELGREPVGATPVPSKRCDSEDSEYFTKNPVFTPRKSRGQPAKMTAKRKSFVATLVSLGFSLRQIARDLRIDHSTISRAAQRDPDFAAALVRAKEERSLYPQLGFRGWRSALDVLQRLEVKRGRRKSFDIR